MKTYKSLEDWKKDWTGEKQVIYEKVKEEKYGSDSKLLINDKELSKLTGKVISIIQIKPQ